ncbi:MAG TPA: FAD-dependent monooxygenase [Ktedonobacterales bacterium]
MDSDYDVIVVGARVAGASLALLLGQQGHRVLLIDRDGFPSDTLSTHFVGGVGIASLRRLGVLADIEAAGFRRITRSRTWIDDCLFEGPSGPDGVYGLAPRRDALDSILIRHARERGGVEFQERTRAEGLLWEDERVVGVALRGPDDERRDVRARVVVGADGKFSKVAAWVKAERYADEPAMRPAYYGYFHGLTPLPDTAVEIIFSQNRIGFVFPMRPDEDCLALEIQPEEWEAFRDDPRAAFEERFRALPGMAARTAGLRLEGKMQGTRGVENYLRKPFGAGWALTGDAGYLKDFSTGLGIGDALAQAFLLADALDAALRGADWDATMGEFQQTRDEMMMPMYQWTLLATRARDASPEVMAGLRGALISPHYTRQAMYWFSSALRDEAPAHLQGMGRLYARVFGAGPAVVPELAPTPVRD